MKQDLLLLLISSTVKKVVER